MVAQAGYTGRFADPVYIHELPCYSLPDFKFKTDGTMRSFEVSGESMEPTLNQGILLSADTSILSIGKNKSAIRNYMSS